MDEGSAVVPPARQVAIVDYGSGNLASVATALRRAGADPHMVTSLQDCAPDIPLVLPGVGAFASCQHGLSEAGLVAPLRQRIQAGQPFLGICVGMQLLFEVGLEGGAATPGLGLFTGQVEQLVAPVLPQMGWNTLEPEPGASFPPDWMYFVHSYAVTTPTHSPRLGQPVRHTWSTYGGQRFLAGLECANVSATQFHPEKSGAAGRRLIQRWLASADSASARRRTL